MTLEDELFLCLPDTSIDALLLKAKERVGEDLVNQQLVAKSNGLTSLASIEALRPKSPYPLDIRVLLGEVSRTKKKSWFKSLTTYQSIVLDIVSRGYADADASFKAVVDQLWAFTRAA